MTQTKRKSAQVKQKEKELAIMPIDTIGMGPQEAKFWKAKKQKI